MTRPLPLLAALCAVVLLAAGCTKDKPDPNYSSVTPTASASTSQAPPTSTSPSVPTTGPNVNPGEVAPTQPASADSRTSDGAIAFLSYYYRLSDWAFATSQVSFLEPLFAPDCKACKEGQSNLASTFGNGQYVTGGRITTRSVQLVENDGRGGAEFAITGVFSVTAAEVHAAGGAVVRTFPASDQFQLTDWVKWDGKRWLIVDEGKA